MDHELTAQFLDLLERQLDGDPEARNALRDLPVVYESGECLWRMHNEWRAAFSYDPGRNEILPLLIPLARWLKRKKRDYTLQFAANPEWQQIGELTGPAETVGFHKCVGCDFEYPSIGTSGHYNALGLPCDKCGDIFWCDMRGNPEIPLCRCGGEFLLTWPCARCGHEEYSVIGRMSPYEYFASHQFTLGPDA